MFCTSIALRIVLGLWGNSASTASTGELLGTERVQNPVRIPPAVFWGGAVITMLTLLTVTTVMGSVGQCLVFVGFCCTVRCRTCLVDFTGKIHVIYGIVIYGFPRECNLLIHLIQAGSVI